MPRLTTLRGTVAGLLTAAVLLAAPATACAWELSKSTNGVIINRESTDSTSFASIINYYDYKGGESWGTTYSASDSGAYRKNVNYGTQLGSIVGESIEIPLASGYRCQMILVTCSGVSRAMCVLNEPLDVNVKASVPGTVSVANVVAISDQSTPSAVVTLSVPASLSVGVDSIGPVGSDGLWLAASVGAFLSGVALYRGVFVHA